VDFEERLPYRAIYLARYSQEKQHESLIRVFHKVVQKHPSASLNLYGYGNRKEAIIEQIEDLGLENNIFVNDFVDNTDRIYNSAILGILPSRVEGFSLFLLECIAHGCLVVSYDIDYGPADMIDQDINGILVETNNEEEMAQKIIDLFNDEDKMKEMSQASYKKSELFHPESIAEKWSVLIEKVLKKKGI
jgi:poly(glycerol-phosphate) alpha-glucosyltransferase